MTTQTAAAVATPTPARIGRLRLYCFRSYGELRLELGPGLNVFVGENAQGKSNLLEAVASLLLTRSPRSSTNADLLRWGSDEAAVEGEVVRPAGSETLTLRLRRDSGRVTRLTLIDGNPRPARDLLGRCPVVVFWPEDLQLVKAGPEGRRRLLDMLVSQLDRQAAEDLIRYRRTLEQRNALLRQLRAGGLGRRDDLAAFDHGLVDHGSRIQVARAELIAALGPLAAAAMTEISDSREELSLRYAPDGSSGGSNRETVAAELRGRIDEVAGEELARGVSLVGPHRDDMEYVIDGRAARATASQGQQRSAVLATKLAEVRHVESRALATPIVLLDDVLSELDGGRRERLLAGLGGMESPLQTLVTTSDGDRFDSPALTRFRVAGGQVTALR
jgi:DNA replication and repair protein RecF